MSGIAKDSYKQDTYFTASQRKHHGGLFTSRSCWSSRSISALDNDIGGQFQCFKLHNWAKAQYLLGLQIFAACWPMNEHEIAWVAWHWALLLAASNWTCQMLLESDNDLGCVDYHHGHLDCKCMQIYANKRNTVYAINLRKFSWKTSDIQTLFLHTIK